MRFVRHSYLHFEDKDETTKTNKFPLLEYTYFIMGYNLYGNKILS